MTYEKFKQLMNVLSFDKLSKILSNSSLEVQMAAVKQNGSSIEYIKKPSLEIQMAAVKQNGSSIEYIKKPSLEIQMAAVKQNGSSIEYIKKPSLEVQMEAVKQNCYSIKHIKKPFLEVQKYCLDKYNDCFFLENGRIENICKICKKEECTFRFGDGIYEKCPYYLEHIALKGK